MLPTVIKPTATVCLWFGWAADEDGSITKLDGLGVLLSGFAGTTIGSDRVKPFKISVVPTRLFQNFNLKLLPDFNFLLFNVKCRLISLSFQIKIYRTELDSLALVD